MRAKALGVVLFVLVLLPAASTAKEPTVTAGGVTVTLPVGPRGTVGRDVVLDAPRLFIPRGFPLDQVPRDLDEAAAYVSSLPRGYTPPAVGAHISGPYPHWSRYYWSGGAETSSVRAFWVLDRTQYGEEPYVQAWVNDWNGYYGPLVGGNWPRVAYYDNDAWDNTCYNTNSFGWSFMTFCTRDDGPFPQLAASYVDASDCCRHHGKDYQPHSTVDPNVSVPYLRKNAVTHEMGHILGLGHRNPGTSVMGGLIDGAYYGYDAHDLDVLRGLYNHGGD
jgi:hypothetical protein